MKFFHFDRARAFVRDRRGNVAVLFALAAVPLFIALAVVVDYARAAKVRGEVAAIADAAVLEATTPAMMAQTAATAKAAATALFAAQAKLVSGFTYTASSLNVTVTDTTSSNAIKRTVNVTYNGKATNAFGAYFVAQNATNFTVNASVSTTSAPNIDFYMLIDNSPSMELPATSDGVAKMITDTGCAFACHENNVSDSENTVQYAGFGTIDSYTYARNSGISLRIDNVKDAVNRVASTAQTTMDGNGATYRMGVYGFNYGFSALQSLITTTAAHQSNINNAVSSLLPPLMDSNGNLAGNQKFTYPTGANTWTDVTLNSTPVNTNDAMTDFTMAMTKMNATITAPGNGANRIGDNPQGVLMLVTDGVADASMLSSTGCSTSSTLSYSNTYGSYTRCMQPIDTAMCTTIKNRGVRIAVLYLTYQPLTGQAFYDTYVSPFIGQVSSNLQSCASSPNLFHEVTTGGDIQSALSDLFNAAVSSAPRLTN